MRGQKWARWWRRRKWAAQGLERRDFGRGEVAQVPTVEFVARCGLRVAVLVNARLDRALVGEVGNDERMTKPLPSTSRLLVSVGEIQAG